MSSLSESVDAAIADDFDLLRAAGELSRVLSGAPGWDDLFVYESSLNPHDVLPEEYPLAAGATAASRYPLVRVDR